MTVFLNFFKSLLIIERKAVYYIFLQYNADLSHVTRMSPNIWIREILLLVLSLCLKCY